MIFPLPGGLGQIKASLVTSALSPPTLVDGGGTPALSNSNRTLTSTATTAKSALGTAVGAKSNNSSKRYFEVTTNDETAVASTFAGGYAGVCNSTDSTGLPLGIVPGYDINSWAIGLDSAPNFNTLNNGAIAHSFGPATGGGGPQAGGDTFMVAVDFAGAGSTVNMWFGVDGIWFNQGAFSTVFSPSSPDFIGPQTPASLWPCVGTNGAPAASGTKLYSVTINTGNAAFQFPPPSGFVAWG